MKSDHEVERQLQVQSGDYLERRYNCSKCPKRKSSCRKRPYDINAPVVADFLAEQSRHAPESAVTNASWRNPQRGIEPNK